jgi:hypothetical protein
MYFTQNLFHSDQSALDSDSHLPFDSGASSLFDAKGPVVSLRIGIFMHRAHFFISAFLLDTHFVHKPVI